MRSYENLSGSSYTVENLPSETDMQWYVIPVIDDFSGICTSGKWTFILRPNAEYAIDLAEINDIVIESGNEKTQLVKLTNIGNVNDIIELQITFDYPNASIVILEGDRHRLEPEQSISLSIKMPTKLY